MSFSFQCGHKYSNSEKRTAEGGNLLNVKTTKSLQNIITQILKCSVLQKFFEGAELTKTIARHDQIYIHVGLGGRKFSVTNSHGRIVDYKIDDL